MKNIVLYITKDKNVELEVNLQDETVWLTQKQIALLFNTQRPAITKHLRKIFESGELQENRVSSILEHTAEDKKTYKTKFYNLDAIISVGYRVNSQSATQFRIWATNVLRDYLVEGYKINEKRLRESEQKFIDLQKTINLLDNVVEQRKLGSDEARGLLKVVSDYSYALGILDRYDNKTLSVRNVTKGKVKKIVFDDITNIIRAIKSKVQTGSLFGQIRSNQLDSIINAIYQTFDSKDLYPSIEEKAANLLYFMIKDHPFADGNKRIGAASFLHFLNINSFLYGRTGGLRIANNTLVALTLMIAESEAKDKDIILNVIINLINKNN